MNVTVESTGACRRVLHVEVPAETVVEEYGRVVKGFIASARVDGFRKGKAPVAVVESKYKEDILESTRDNLIPRCYHDALDKEAIQPVNIIGVSDVNISKSSPMTFDVTVDVSPDVSVEGYKGLPATRDVQEIGTDDVDRSIRALLEQRATYEDVEGRAAKVGDLAKISFTGTIGGVAITELDDIPTVLGEANEFWYNTSPDEEYLPGMSAALEGAEVGSSLTAEVTFADDHHIVPLAGKTAAYSVSLEGLRQQMMPELNEEIWSVFEVDSEEALRERIKLELTESAGRQAEQATRDQVLQALLEKTSFELPESEVEKESKRTLERMVYDNLMRGISREQLEQDQAEIYKAAQEMSQNRLRVQYVLAKIADTEDIQVDDQDVEAFILKASTSAGQTPEKLKAEIQKNNNMDAVVSDARAEKVLDFLVENAKIS